MSETIDNASFSFGFMCAEIEFSFGTPKRREAWLTKICVVKSRTPDGKQEVWTLPDGAYARFSLPGNVEVWKAAGQALARHMCEQIALHEAESAVQPHKGNFGLENDMPDFDSRHPDAVDDAGQTI